MVDLAVPPRIARVVHPERWVWDSMAALRRVNDWRAGPRALGILVPPGPETVVIVRPRSLRCDLLLLSHEPRSRRASPFLQVPQEPARKTALDLLKALEAWAEGRLEGQVDTVASADGSTHQVYAEIGDFTLLVCARDPGRAYRPQEFASAEDARALAEVLRVRLRPTAGGEQEIYLNLQNFAS